ncbi:MAG: FecCD family ABC transporter permease [Peptostreptococcaceae bacterium]
MKQNSFRNKKLIVGALILLSILIIYGNISLGNNNYSFDQIISAIASNDNTNESLIINQIRIPRAIVGFFVGSSLALAGLVIQSITQNRLTSSQILGVNSGVTFVSVLALIYLPFVGYMGRVGFGIVAALVVVLTVLKLSKNSSKISVANLPLSGLVIGVFLTSLTQSILLLNEEAAETMMFYMIGSFVRANWESVIVLVPVSIVCIIMLLILSRNLKVIELGNDMALSLGVNMSKYVFIFVVIVSLLAGTSVSIAGPVGFIGIIVPNLVRKIVSSDYKFLIVMTSLVGGILASLSDLISKFISYPYETPVGLVISFIGVPMFLYVAMSERSKR